MALKTQPNDASVDAFLEKIRDDARRRDCRAVLRMMKQATGAEPRMWGSSIVGFGTHHYKYETGREGDWFVAGFSPRKQNLTIYLMSGYENHGPLLAKLGKHSTGKSCLYIKRLADVDLGVLRRLITESVKHAR